MFLGLHCFDMALVSFFAGIEIKRYKNGNKVDKNMERFLCELTVCSRFKKNIDMGSFLFSV